MGREALSRLFAVFGAFVSLYALSAAVLLQGGTALSVVPGLEPRSPAQSFYFATIVVGFSLMITAVVAIAHVRLPIPANSTGWAFPIVWLGDVEIEQSRHWSVRVYVFALVSIIFLIPSGALYHFNVVMNQNGVVWNESLPAAATYRVGCTFHFWPFAECNADEQKQYIAFASVPAFKDGKENGLSRSWLSSHECDFAAWREMTGPQVVQRTKLKGPAVTHDELVSRSHPIQLDPASRTRLEQPHETDSEEVRYSYCASPALRSDLCVADVSKCRGIEWTSFSPILVMVSTVIGWVSTFSFLIIWLCHERSSRAISSISAPPGTRASAKRKRR